MARLACSVSWMQHVLGVRDECFESCVIDRPGRFWYVVSGAIFPGRARYSFEGGRKGGREAERVVGKVRNRVSFDSALPSLYSNIHFLFMRAVIYACR